MFFETFESRTLMSVTAVSTAVTEDRLQIKAALSQFRADIDAKTATLVADGNALRAADVQHDATLAPLFAQLHKDVKAMRFTLKNDRLAQKSSVLKDESVIVADRLQYRLDRGNPAARKADKAKLLADHIQLQKDDISGLNARIATRESDYTQIFNDITAITTAAQSDTNALPELLAAVNTFASDRTATLNTLTADLHRIVADRSQLVLDLTALQSQA